jgi:hypothetical protein
MFIVQVCDFPLNGQAFYRYHEPARGLSRCGAAVVDCDPLHRLLPLLADAADVLVLQTFDWEWVPVLRRRRALGRVTVVEASDDYFDIQPWNPGSVVWADALEREKLTQLLAEADAVQTTNDAAAARGRPPPGGRHGRRPAAPVPNNHLRTEVVGPAGSAGAT